MWSIAHDLIVGVGVGRVRVDGMKWEEWKLAAMAVRRGDVRAINMFWLVGASLVGATQ